MILRPREKLIRKRGFVSRVVEKAITESWMKYASDGLVSDLLTFNEARAMLVRMKPFQDTEFMSLLQ